MIHFDSQLFWIFIYFDLRFNLILLILIRLDFDSSQITIHPQIMIHLRIKIISNRNQKEVSQDSLISNDLIDSISNQKRIKVNHESSWPEPWYKEILLLERPYDNNGARVYRKISKSRKYDPKSS